MQKQLLQALSTQMPRFGFGSRIIGQSFLRPEPFGVASLHLSFIAHKTEFDVTADVALRINSIEELLNKSNRLLSDKEKKQTFTVGAELGNISEGRQRRWTISNGNHVPLVATGIIAAFEQIGLPYLEHISNLEALLYLLSSHNREAWLSSPIHDRRCKTVIALARLLGKSEAESKLAAECDAYLRERNDSGLNSFREFVQGLRGVSE